MAEAVHIRYDAPPTLGSFLESDAFVRGVKGPVGSGKSSACIVEILRRATQQAPSPDGVRRTRFAVIRNTYRELQDTTRKTFEQWIPAQLGRWHEQDFTFHMRFRDVDCEVLFRALDRPEDVKKLLSLELTGAYINEFRELPKHVFDVLQTRVGRYPSKAQGGATWFGIWADTNPWHSGHWAAKLFAQRSDDFRLWCQPGGRDPAAENVENLPAGYYERLCHGKDSEWIRVYVDGQDAAGDVGSVYGAWLAALEARGGVCDFDYPPTGVFTTWDLGLGDSTAIWFWRVNEQRRFDLLDYYEAHGEGLPHYFRVVDGKGLLYAKHWLPHDATHKTLATQVSVLDQCLAHFGAGNVAIAPKLSVADGIAAARWLLEQPIRIHARCGEALRDGWSGLDVIREYRFKWDEDDKCFSREPVHDWASHGADALRYTALVARQSELMTRPEERPTKPVARSLNTFTLDELFELDAASRSRKERV